jgi:hypothetical protein
VSAHVQDSPGVNVESAVAGPLLVVADWARAAVLAAQNAANSVKILAITDEEK